jgi:hypothetical protein
MTFEAWAHLGIWVLVVLGLLGIAGAMIETVRAGRNRSA